MGLPGGAMVRPLLIAFLTVTALAGPVAALGPLPLVEPSPVVATDVEPEDLLAMASSTEQRASQACHIELVEVTQEPSNGPVPDLGVDVDPNNCLNRLVDCLVELVWPWVEMPVLLQRTALADGLALDLAASQVLASDDCFS